MDLPLAKRDAAPSRHQSTKKENMPTGKIVSFNEGHGYGFVRSNGGPDVFIHARDAENLDLQPGDRVVFDVVENPHKPGKFMAQNLRFA